MDIIEQIKPFLEPESVAIVGGKLRTVGVEFSILEYLLDLGYQGKIYLVNPSISEISGRKSYPSVREIAERVDLAVISTRRSIVPGIVSECIEKGIKSILIVTQGFADAADQEGKNLQEEIVRIAREGGSRVIGPNTIGTANAFINFSTSFLKQLDMQRIPVGLVCQTGTFFAKISELSLLGKGIDLGNASDIDFADCLEYFEQDPQIKLIVLHIEGIKDGRRFFEVSSRVARKKPILALKSGTSKKAAKAAQSHTGSLIGKDEVWDAALKQCGIIRVGDLDELSDIVKAFCLLPPMKGRGLAMLSISGGLGVMTLDACERHGLEMIKLSPETERKIIEMSPSWAGIGNPVDIWPAMLTSEQSIVEVLGSGLEVLLKDPKVNAVLLTAGAWLEGLSPPISKVVSEVANAFKDKPVVCFAWEGFMYQIQARELEDKLKEAGKVAVFPTVDRAVRALAKLASYSEFKARCEGGS